MLLLIHGFYPEMVYNHPAKLYFSQTYESKLCAMSIDRFKICRRFKGSRFRVKYLASGPADLQERFALGALRLWSGSLSL
jgi:hypothetical protein